MNDINKNESIVGTGDIVTIEGKRFRILDFDDIVTMVAVDIEKIDMLDIGQKLLVEGIASGTYRVDKYKEPKIYIPDSKNEKYPLRLAMINEIKDKYHGSFPAFVANHSSDYLQYLCNKYSIGSPSTFWRIIRRYMQSGYSNVSLMPIVPVYPNQKKYCKENGNCGANSENGEGYIMNEEDERNVKEAIDLYLHDVITLDDAYNILIDTHYTHYETDENGDKRLYRNGYGECPSFKQFCYRYYKYTTEKERAEGNRRLDYTHSSDDRLLPSSELEEVTYPGEIVHIDACEIDLSMVDQREHKYTVGRPTLYVMKDVYSKKALSFALGYGRNSLEAVIKVLVNLVVDKVKFCEKYGIFGIKAEHWESGILPRIIRVDRGAEFVSQEFRRILNELGITLQYVRGGSGSLKGSVEQFFRQYHFVIKPFLKNLGVIEKDYFSRHHAEAVLDIIEATKITAIMIIYYNNTPMEKYPRTEDMVIQKVVPTPNNIWKYGVENINAPRKIENPVQFLKALLLHGKATISAKGVEFRHIRYWNGDNRELYMKMIKANAERKTYTIEILYDPNSIAKIYYVNEKGKMVDIPINLRLPNQQSLEKYSFAMVDAYWKELNKEARIAKEKKRNMESERDAHIAGVVEDAVSNSPTKPSVKNMRVNRRNDAFYDSYRGSVTEGINNQMALPGENKADDKALPDAPEKDTTVKKEDAMGEENNHRYSRETHYDSMWDCL